MYGILGYQKFGEQLLTTKDLDPVYVMLHNAKLPYDNLARFCLAYWCFYHVGVAARISEQRDRKYWLEMKKAYHFKWPRGAERRHFRGEKALQAIERLARYRSPETVVHVMLEGCNTFNEISESVQVFPQFGPWIAFKVADMAERVLEHDVDFSDCHLGIYREPLAGAKLIHGPDCDIRDTVATLEREFRAFLAPPRYDRPVNVQEVETILCKYKSHYNGRYPLGKDRREIYEALHGWGGLAEHLQAYIP